MTSRGRSLRLAAFSMRGKALQSGSGDVTKCGEKSHEGWQICGRYCTNFSCLSRSNVLAVGFHRSWPVCHNTACVGIIYDRPMTAPQSRFPCQFLPLFLENVTWRVWTRWCCFLWYPHRAQNKKRWISHSASSSEFTMRRIMAQIKTACLARKCAFELFCSVDGWQQLRKALPFVQHTRHTGVYAAQQRQQQRWW